MKYTKDNIIGLNFKTHTSLTLFKIDRFIDTKRVVIIWGKSHYIDYYILDVIKYLEDGTWKIINQEPTYEIY